MLLKTALLLLSTFACNEEYFIKQRIKINFVINYKPSKCSPRVWRSIAKSLASLKVWRPYFGRQHSMKGVSHTFQGYSADLPKFVSSTQTLTPDCVLALLKYNKKFCSTQWRLIKYDLTCTDGWWKVKLNWRKFFSKVLVPNVESFKRVCASSGWPR